MVFGRRGLLLCRGFLGRFQRPIRRIRVSDLGTIEYQQQKSRCDEEDTQNQRGGRIQRDGKQNRAYVEQKISNESDRGVWREE